MKRALLVAAAVPLLAAPSAQAKCCALTTPPAPGDLVVGEEWLAQVELEGEGWRSKAPLTVIAWRDSTRTLVSVEARATKTPRIYIARVTFPEPGTWTYTVSVGGFAGSLAAPVRDVAISERRDDASRTASPAIAAGGALFALALIGLLARARGQEHELSVSDGVQSNTA